MSWSRRSLRKAGFVRRNRAGVGCWAPVSAADEGPRRRLGVGGSARSPRRPRSGRAPTTPEPAESRRRRSVSRGLRSPRRPRSGRAPTTSEPLTIAPEVRMHPAFRLRDDVTPDLMRRWRTRLFDPAHWRRGSAFGDPSKAYPVTSLNAPRSGTSRAAQRSGDRQRLERNAAKHENA
jgi:hypothetical protein